MYFHDDGEQYYLHQDSWPKVPPIKHVRKIDSSIDTVVRKELTISNQACQEYISSYFGKHYSYKQFLFYVRYQISKFRRFAIHRLLVICWITQIACALHFKKSFHQQISIAPYPGSKACKGFWNTTALLTQHATHLKTTLILITLAMYFLRMHPTIPKQNVQVMKKFSFEHMFSYG